MTNEFKKIRDNYMNSSSEFLPFPQLWLPCLHFSCCICENSTIKSLDSFLNNKSTKGTTWLCLYHSMEEFREHKVECIFSYWVSLHNNSIELSYLCLSFCQDSLLNVWMIISNSSSYSFMLQGPLYINDFQTIPVIIALEHFSGSKLANNFC